MRTRSSRVRAVKARCSCNCDSSRQHENSPKQVKSKKKPAKTARKSNNNNEQLIKQCVVILKRLPAETVKKTVKFKEDEKPKKLRKRKTVNYAESSLEISTNTQKSRENRLPIYKQLNSSDGNKPKKRHEDAYEFDSSDGEKRAKRKKRRLNGSSSDESYEKTMENMLKRVVNRVKKKKKVQKPVKKTNTVTQPLPVINEPETVQMSPKIKMISDVQLNPSNEVIWTTPGKPNANSTMISNVFTPWRFNDINIKRNPHFITLKESSLPCISQEMVLDHTMVDKFGDHSKIEKNITKTPIQKRVTDYFSFDKPRTGEDKENQSQVSLFDSDMFSPIKSASQVQVSRIGTVKRRILGEKCDNVHVSTPKQDANLTNFGFDSNSDSKRSSPEKDKDNKPFRLSVNLNDRKYTRKAKYKKAVKAVTVASSDDEGDVAESYSGECRLFDDFDETFEGDRVDQDQVVRKKRKRQRFDDPNHQRRKDVRTEKEEEEAEKWAAAFNSLCEEIEEFPLEIE